MATYGPGIDQSQHAKSVSHITMIFIDNELVPYVWQPRCLCLDNWLFLVRV